MAKLKDIPFGSEIPTFDNSGYITLSSGLKDSSGNTIITMASGSAFFDGEACYAGGTSYACCACEACCAGEACVAWSARYASEACCACCACCAGLAGDACYACYACEACDALYLSHCNSHLQPSYCNSLSAYLLV